MPSREEVKTRWARLTALVPAWFLIAYFAESIMLIAICIWGLYES